jgi:hypothetical protein
MNRLPRAPIPLFPSTLRVRGEESIFRMRFLTLDVWRGRALVGPWRGAALRELKQG